MSQGELAMVNALPLGGGLGTVAGVTAQVGASKAADSDPCDTVDDHLCPEYDGLHVLD